MRDMSYKYDYLNAKLYSLTKVKICPEQLTKRENLFFSNCVYIQKAQV